MTKEKSLSETPVESSDRSEKLMYVGPTILDPVPLAHRSVFSSLPVMLRKQSREIQTALGDCFIPLSQAAAALRELEGAKAAGRITEKYKTAQRLLRSVK